MSSYSPTPTSSPTDRLVRIARLGLGLSTLITIAYVTAAIITQSWYAILLAVGFALIAVVSAVIIRARESDNPLFGVWQFISAIILAALLVSSIETNAGAEVGATVLVIILAIAIQILPSDQVFRAAALGAIVSLVCSILAYYSPLPQAADITANPIVIWTTRGLTLLLLALLLSQYRSLQIASKLLFSFLAVVAVINLTFNIIMTTVTAQLMTAQIGRELQTVTNSRSTQIGDFLKSQIDNLQVLAFNETIQEGLATANSYHTGDETQILAGLVERDQEWRRNFENNITNPFIEFRLTNPAAIELGRYVNLYPIIIDTLMTDSKGALAGSSNLTTNYYFGDEEWWRKTFNDGQGGIFISPPEFNQLTNTVSIFISIPVQNKTTLDVNGTLHAAIAIDDMVASIENTEIFGGSTDLDIVFPGLPAKQLHNGELLDADPIILTHIAELEQEMMLFASEVYEGENSLFTASTVSTNADIPAINQLGWKTVIHQSEVEALAPVRDQVRLVSSLGTIMAGIAALLSLLISQRLAQPIANLTATASEVSGGNLDARAEVTTQDEIGQLANTFNTMTSELQGMLVGLEERVAERTLELEDSTQQLERRSGQFEAIAQLARTVASIQDLEALLPRITQLVSELFGFYHVGLFLLDESRHFAVLSAANSAGGQKMLERHHSLAVGQTGIVGYVTATGNPRIVLDTGADAVFFDNPDLPETRSEMALPLQAGNEIIGALDVQSKQPNAFSEDDVEVLSILADEVSIAIDNARLHEESQRLLADAQSAFTEFTRDAWKNLSKSSKVMGYKLTGTTIKALDEKVDSNGSTISIPIKFREQVIGNVNISLPENQEMDQDEADIAQALIERLGSAIEVATLLEETRRRALKEQAIGEITSKIGSSINMRNVLQTAVEELGRALPSSEVVIQFTENDEAGGPKSK